jgi:AcrR family transcriptional regulator
MQDERPPLTPERIVAACRLLLREGGVEALVVREVARRLNVSAAALYKHAAGRDDLLTLLIAECQEEVAAVCARARDGCPPDDAPAQLRAATVAFRGWALQHPREFHLLYGQPIIGYRAPPEGPTTQSARRFGDVFAGIYAQLLRDGRLRLPAPAEMPRGFSESPAEDPVPRDAGLPPAAVYQFAKGFQRMLGLVSVEVSGHLDWAMADTEGFVINELRHLADELILPE